MNATPGPLSAQRMREIYDFLFAKRLRALKSEAAEPMDSPSRKRKREEDEEETTEPRKRKREEEEKPESRKRKREAFEKITIDEIDEEEEHQRLRRPIAPSWMPTAGHVPLLQGNPIANVPAYYARMHKITIVFGTQSVSFWSHSNERNAHKRSADVFFVGGFDFPNDHYYIIDGIRGGYVSVSGFLHHFFPDFDKARYRLAAQCLTATNPKSPYAQMVTSQEVFDFWDKVRDNGTCYHAAIDDTLQGRPLRSVYQVGKSDEIHGPPPGFARFMIEHPELEVHFTEFTVFDRGLVLVGQFDALFWDKVRQCFVLVDWKNVMTFRTRATEKGTHPLTAGMDDCHLSHYSLQLNLYRALLERRFGFAIADMWIVNFPAFQHDKAPYELYRVTRRNMEPFFALCPISEEGRMRRVWAPAESHD